MIDNFDKSDTEDRYEGNVALDPKTLLKTYSSDPEALRRVLSLASEAKRDAVGDALRPNDELIQQLIDEVISLRTKPFMVNGSSIEVLNQRGKDLRSHELPRGAGFEDFGFIEDEETGQVFAISHSLPHIYYLKIS